jgi:hypothetical protein
MSFDISIERIENSIKQFCMHWIWQKMGLGDFLGDFSWTLGDFFTKTSGHPGRHQEFKSDF